MRLTDSQTTMTIRNRGLRTDRHQDSKEDRARWAPVLTDKALAEAVLQLCRSGLIWWANAPCVIGFRSVQVEAIRTGSHPSGGWLVSAFFLVVPGRRGVARRARSARRSRYGVRWVQRYAPEMARRLRSRLRPTNDSWRVDETYIRVKGKWVYLYRA